MALLSDRQVDRYSRQIMLEQIGYKGQERLAASSAFVAGAGGLGTVVLERLAGMGVGRIVVMDRDIVEESNLHRQSLYTEADIGRPKAAAAAERMREINSSVEAVAAASSLTAEGAMCMAKACDVAIDALDTAAARYVLNAACISAATPLVSGAAVGMEGQALTIVPGATACYRCVFGVIDDSTTPKCATTGVHPSILSVIGGIEAAEAASVLTGRKPSLAGRLLYADVDSMEFSTMNVMPDAGCPACASRGGSAAGAAGAAGSAAPDAPGGIAVEDLCGRGRGRRAFAVSKCGAAAARAQAQAVLAAGPDRTRYIDGVCERMRANGMLVERSGPDGVTGVRGDASISVVGPACAIVTGTGGAEEAREMYRLVAGGTE